MNDIFSKFLNYVINNINYNKNNKIYNENNINYNKNNNIFNINHHKKIFINQNNNIFNINNIKIKNTYNTNNNSFNIKSSYPYIIYKVYQMRTSVVISLSSLSLGLERKVKCYNECFVNGYVFHTENTSMEERHTTTVFVLRDRLVVGLKLTTMVN
jgi:hypothetical protein